MLNYIKKSIQISGISAILLGTAIFSYPAQAIEASQTLGENITWQCGLSPAIRLDRDKASPGTWLPCETQAEKAVKLSTTAADPAAVSQLIQQGVQLLQIAQPLIQQLLQPLSSSAPQSAQQSPAPVKK
jgi:hypothetical protein